jgi:hypothetical protein
MLRTLFHETNRENEGRLKQITELMDELSERYESTRGGSDGGQRSLRLLNWMKSIAATLDELEQSVYCADRYAGRVEREFIGQMAPQERDDYRRHLYFYKNGFIRVFSVLDKLGSFLNERFSMRTEQVKERYSYFTVLRRMREIREHGELLHRLNDIKDQYREPVQDLRLMRNHEVHAMNTELLDHHGQIRTRSRDGKEKIEDLRQNNEMLHSGYEMVCESLYAVLLYCKKH